MQATDTPVLCTLYYCFQLEDELNNYNDQEDTGKALTPPIIFMLLLWSIICLKHDVIPTSHQAQSVTYLPSLPIFISSSSLLSSSSETPAFSTQLHQGTVQMKSDGIVRFAEGILFVPLGIVISVTCKILKLFLNTCTCGQNSSISSIIISISGTVKPYPVFTKFARKLKKAYTTTEDF